MQRRAIWITGILFGCLGLGVSLFHFVPLISHPPSPTPIPGLQIHALGPDCLTTSPATTLVLNYTFETSDVAPDIHLGIKFAANASIDGGCNSHWTGAPHGLVAAEIWLTIPSQHSDYVIAVDLFVIAKHLPQETVHRTLITVLPVPATDSSS